MGAAGAAEAGAAAASGAATAITPSATSDNLLFVISSPKGILVSCVREDAREM
jgi:hypothetical protein